MALMARMWLRWPCSSCGRRQAHAQRGAEQRGFDIVHAQRVAAEQRLTPSRCGSARQARHAARMHHHRTRHHHAPFALLRAYAAPSAAVCRTAVSTCRSDEMPFDMKANASRSRSFDSGATRMPRMTPHDHVARRRSRSRRHGVRRVPSLHHDHGVHALVLHLDPLRPRCAPGAVIGGGVEILRSAAVALHRAQRRVAASHRRSSRGSSNCASTCSISWRRRRFHRRRRYDGLAVGAADAELLHLETAVDSTTLSKICSITCESIRWPSASTTS
jgi:hypothetical protein